MSSPIEIKVIPINTTGQVKCPRCFHFSYSMLQGGVCNRCAGILTKYYPDHDATRQLVDELALRGLSPQDNPQWNNV